MAAAVPFLASPTPQTRGAEAAATDTPAPNVEPKLKLGLVGCGGRGSWIADLFAQNPNYRLVACAD